MVGTIERGKAGGWIGGSIGLVPKWRTVFQQVEISPKPLVDLSESGKAVILEIVPMFCMLCL